VSSPSGDEHPLRLFFLFSFLAARERLYVASSYFVPDRQLREAAMGRAQEGVDVRILIPGKHTDAKPIREASHSYYDDLLSAGVRIFEYQPTMFHMKSLVVDGKWSVVGSANMDIRSKELNHENVLHHGRGSRARSRRPPGGSEEGAAEIRLTDWRRRRGPASRSGRRPLRGAVPEHGCPRRDRFPPAPRATSAWCPRRPWPSRPRPARPHARDGPRARATAPGRKRPAEEAGRGLTDRFVRLEQAGAAPGGSLAAIERRHPDLYERYRLGYLRAGRARGAT
jgi:hypothetical protein